MPGGVGSAQVSWATCRNTKSSSSPIPGRSDGPNSDEADQEQSEEIDEAGAGDEQDVRRVRVPSTSRPCSGAVQSCTASPIAPSRTSPAPISDATRTTRPNPYPAIVRTLKLQICAVSRAWHVPDPDARPDRKQREEHDALHARGSLAPSGGRLARSSSSMVSIRARTRPIIESPSVPRSRPGGTSMASPTSMAA